MYSAFSEPLQSDEETMFPRLCLPISLIPLFATGFILLKLQSKNLDIILAPFYSLLSRTRKYYDHLYHTQEVQEVICTKTLTPSRLGSQNLQPLNHSAQGREDPVGTLQMAKIATVPTKKRSSRVTQAGITSLQKAIGDKSFFKLPVENVMKLLRETYRVEIDFLQTAYAASCPESAVCTTKSPSQIIFGSKYAEVDRTLCGVLSLIWIHNRNYVAFTNNQPEKGRLSQQSFDLLCDLFWNVTSNFEDTTMLFTLVTMQVTNDLGKSSSLKRDLQAQLPSGKPSLNHDMVMHEALQYAPELVPSFKYLDSAQEKIVRKLIQLSANFNPGQLVQAECPPAALDILTELDITSTELDIKFLEYFLDLSGATGHITHEGAATLKEPVFRVFWSARQISAKVAKQELTPTQAYDTVLHDRLSLLQKAGWAGCHALENIHATPAAYAKSRIFCMGRVADSETANLYDTVYNELPEQVRERLEKALQIRGSVGQPAVLPTYTPAMLNLAGGSPRRREAITAVLTYVSRALQLSPCEVAELPADTVIVERDVKDVLENLIKSDGFKKNPSSVVNEETELSVLEPTKRCRTT